jgi:enoyl-CoA hydratase/carnithine racemase
MAVSELMVEVKAPLAWLTLNRPDKANALSQAMISELRSALETLADEKPVRVILVQGMGKHFCSGHRLDELLDQSEPEFYNYMDNLRWLMLTLNQQPQPVIAKVHGFAGAGGCLLAAACDLIVAAEDARFCLPGVKIGVMSAIPTVPLSRCIGTKRALEMLLTGREVPASEAKEWGLVNQTASQAALDQAAKDLAGVLAKADPEGMALGKQAFHNQICQDLNTAYQTASQATIRALLNPAAKQGIRNFLDKKQGVLAIPEVK